MKHRTVLAVALALGVYAIQMMTPAPAAAQASTPVNAAPRANDGVAREIPSNQVTGIDIDRFIGDPYKALPAPGHSCRRRMARPITRR